MFSKACEYGIKAMIYIASQSLKGQRVKVTDMVNEAGVPEAFTGKILSSLAQKGLLESLKGPYGGYFINENKVKSIKLIDIVSAIDGNGLFENCALGLKQCNAKDPCPMHHKFVKVRGELKHVLDSSNLFELAKSLEAGNTVLNH
ncbi:RrF2 family transcriptional regulator [Pedobacter sp.]|uniref:RrF2 family transcriptional regulator n=1 Tax=Pedobacter sp. TaxID=1411316 RepID=UPI00396C64C3